MNYLAQECQKLWKACHMLSVSSSPLMMVGQRFDIFVLAWVSEGLAGGSQMGDMVSRWGGFKRSGRHVEVQIWKF